MATAIPHDLQGIRYHCINTATSDPSLKSTQFFVINDLRSCCILYLHFFVHIAVVEGVGGRRCVYTAKSFLLGRFEINRFFSSKKIILIFRVKFRLSRKFRFLQKILSFTKKIKQIFVPNFDLYTKFQFLTIFLVLLDF